MKIEHVTIDGTNCIKITIGHVTEDWEIKRCYDDIEAIAHKNACKITKLSNTNYIMEV